MTKTDLPIKYPIVSNPNILGGEPVITGTRIPATLLYELLINREYTPKILITEYPSLTRKRINEFLRLLKDSNHGGSTAKEV